MMPSRYRVVNRRTAASVTASSDTSPSCTARTMNRNVQPQLRSQPADRAMAADSWGVRVTMWPVWKSRTAQQSDTTCPAKPQASRRMSRSRVTLPQQGSPLVLLYAPMTASTFAFVTRSRKAGR